MKQGAGLLRAAAIGAVALLGLKLVGLMYERPREPSQPQSQQAKKPDELPQFMRVIAQARQNPPIPDPETTGSVDKPKDAAATENATAKPASREPRPNEIDRSGVFRGERPQTPSEMGLLERLGERRDTLDSRARELEMRERLMENAEKKLESRIEELRELEKGLGTAVRERDKTAAQGIKNLVTMYETMKPKDAARVFDRLSHDVLIPVVQAMNPRKMAEVLAAMRPESAEKLTVALASKARLAESRLTPGQEAGLPAGELPSLDTAPPRAAPR